MVSSGMAVLRWGLCVGALETVQERARSESQSRDFGVFRIERDCIDRGAQVLCELFDELRRDVSDHPGAAAVLRDLSSELNVAVDVDDRSIIMLAHRKTRDARRM